MKMFAVALAVSLLLAASAAQAERVQVKFRGTLELGHFKCTDVTKGNLIKRVCYDRAKRYMVIRLHDTHYHYCGVDPQTVKTLLSADWPEGYFDTSIKGHFDCRTHRVPRY